MTEYRKLVRASMGREDPLLGAGPVTQLREGTVLRVQPDAFLPDDTFFRCQHEGRAVYVRSDDTELCDDEGRPVSSLAGASGASPQPAGPEVDAVPTQATRVAGEPEADRLDGTKQGAAAVPIVIPPTFGAAREAISCAAACHAAAEAAGLTLHVGIHAGDVLREQNNVYGGAVNIASRISSEADAGETLVSGTVRDLARTSAGVSFEDRGERELKGVGEPVRLFEVRWREE